MHWLIKWGKRLKDTLIMRINNQLVLDTELILLKLSINKGRNACNTHFKCVTAVSGIGTGYYYYIGYQLNGIN